jgi:hypothetical protein
MVVRALDGDELGGGGVVGDAEDNDLYAALHASERAAHAERVVQRLTMQGFTNEQARLALSSCQTLDINDALDWLLANQVRSLLRTCVKCLIDQTAESIPEQYRACDSLSSSASSMISESSSSSSAVSAASISNPAASINNQSQQLSSPASQPKQVQQQQLMDTASKSPQQQQLQSAQFTDADVLNIAQTGFTVADARNILLQANGSGESEVRASALLSQLDANSRKRHFDTTDNNDDPECVAGLWLIFVSHADS